MNGLGEILAANVDKLHIVSKVGFLRNHRIKRVGSKALESGPMLQSDNQGGTTGCFYFLKTPRPCLRYLF